VNRAEDQRWALIPGVFMNREQDKNHAFVQVLDGNKGKAYYHRITPFHAEKDAFDVTIGYSRFTKDKITLDIDDNIGKISGELQFNNLKPWPVKAFSPGYMGWYGWLPFLETYHGVLSFDHEINGTLNIYGQEIDFTGGRGYLEKDWGQSFPECYIWQQTNHFETPETSLTASIALVPNVGRTFAGFGIGFWLQGKLYALTTYNGARVEHLSADDTTVNWVVYNNDYEIRLTSTRSEGGLLMGPERTDMSKRVDETMKAIVDVELYNRVGMRRSLIYKGQGRNAGLEVVGDISPLLKA
ncbi:MAG: hypothetical protein KC496_16520, partial [Anaerolineae bacterium]|nr:hypothetical protein [Anaerolineae bacterium]